MVVKLDDVCERIYAGGDVPKDRFSDTKTDIYNIPIYANAEANQGLYGYTDRAREFDNAVTVAARGTIGYSAIRTEPFLPVVRLITVVPNRTKITLSYLYYALRHYKPKSSGTSIPQLTVPNIKKYTFNLYDINRQEIITNTLDKLQSIIAHRKQQLEKLDELVKARFIELFGDSEQNPRGLPVLPWSKVFLTTTGKLDSNAMVENGQYPFFTCAKESFWIDTYAFDCEALLLAGNNAAGVYDVKHYKGKFNAYQRTYVLRLINDQWSYKLFKRQLEDKLRYLQSQSKGTNTRYLTLGILNELRFVVPPVAEQEQFATFVEQTDKSKVVVQKALDEAQLLFDSLMQEYFG